MIARLHGALLGLFGRLPRPLRRRIVRVVAPSFTVGALCVIERPDGHVVLIRQRYRTHWGLPGGLLVRRETPHDAARREVREEIGVDVELVGAPAVVVEPELQRVDIVYRARLTEPSLPVRCSSPEIVDVEWHPLDGLPELQAETISAFTALGLAHHRAR